MRASSPALATLGEGMERAGRHDCHPGRRDVDLAAGLIAQLGQPEAASGVCHGASGYAKAGCHSEARSNSPSQDERWSAAHRIQAQQAALGRATAVWESGAILCVEVHQGAGLAKREDHTAAEQVSPSLGSNKSGFEQSIEAITMGNQMVCALTDGGA